MAVRGAGAAAEPAGGRARQLGVGRYRDFRLAAFRKGLSDTGYVEGRNVTVEDQRLDGQYDRLPAVMVDLVRRRVAVIVANAGAIAAKRVTTTTIPIIFATNDDLVKTGLVASLARR